VFFRFRKKSGRRGGIRTRDPLHPMQVRYQAALHAEAVIIHEKWGCGSFWVDYLNEAGLKAAIMRFAEGGQFMTIKAFVGV
jgi:hypothetical protein